MENMSDKIYKNIESLILYLISNINYYVVEFEWLFIISGIILSIISIFRNKKSYLFRYEVDKCIKTLVLMIFAGLIIKELKISNIRSIFDIIFYNFMPITIIGIVFMGIMDKYLFYKAINNLKEELYCINICIYVTYIFLLISTSYSIKDTFVPICWQIVFISVRYEINKLQSYSVGEDVKLYKSREKQLRVIVNIIKNFNNDNYAIALTGEWGSGKSVLIEQLINRIQRENYYIYIKPMISDTRETLVKEFKKSISKIMNKQGIYTGRNSSVNKYFNEVLNLIEFNNKVTLSSLVMKNSSNDILYKELKDELQEDINSLLMNYKKKLLIVIDDFDRVEESKQFEILSFMKEIVDFKGCITLIALDYKNLLNNKIVNRLYLEKFVATNIELVNVDFYEIIKFHCCNILKEEELKNDYSKKILHEIVDNICSYYDNIEKRVVDYCNKIKDDLKKTKSNEKDKKEEKLQKFYDFAMKHFENLNNSRRVIHFLEEISNTLIIIDKIYEDREEENKFFYTINSSEIIYFINYLKVFYKECYDNIIEFGGIEEYSIYLMRNEKYLEEEYFKIILGEIIPSENYLNIVSNEKKYLKRDNSLNFIKDVFVNYFFDDNNFELITESEKCLNEIDNSNMFIKDDFEENIKKYQESIFRFSKNDDEINRRINILQKYVVCLFQEGKINFVCILEMATKKRNNNNIKYVIYFLECTDKLILEGKVKGLFENDKRKINSILDDIEFESIVYYKYIFIELLNSLMLFKNERGEVAKIFENIYKSQKVFSKMYDYCIKNKLISNDIEVSKLSDLLQYLLQQLEEKNYKIIDIKLIKQRANEFIKIEFYLHNLKNADIYSEIDLNKYKKMSDNFIIDNEDDIFIYLKELSKCEIIDSDIISCFQQLIKYIVNNNINVDNEDKKVIKNIYERMRIEDCWNEYAWLDISIDMEKIFGN